MVILADRQARSLMSGEPFLGTSDAATFPKPCVKWPGAIGAALAIADFRSAMTQSIVDPRPRRGPRAYPVLGDRGCRKPPGLRPRFPRYAGGPAKRADEDQPWQGCPQRAVVHMGRTASLALLRIPYRRLEIGGPEAMSSAKIGATSRRPNHFGGSVSSRSPRWCAGPARARLPGTVGRRPLPRQGLAGARCVPGWAACAGAGRLRRAWRRSSSTRGW